MKYDGDFEVLVEACAQADDAWRVDSDYGNAFSDSLVHKEGLDEVESLVHELAHWFSMGHRGRPRTSTVDVTRNAIHRMSLQRSDVEEARTIAIELRAFDLLGVQLSDKECRCLSQFATANMSVGRREGVKLVNDYVVRGKNTRDIERCARRVTRVIREGLMSLAEVSA